MMAFARHTLLLAIVSALGTVFIAWWTMPIVAALWTVLAPRRAAVLSAALAGALAWTALLLLAAWAGPLGELAGLMGEIFTVPGFTLLALTVAYGALLSGAAATASQWTVDR